MSKQDVFQKIDKMDAETVQKIVDRLEFRGRDPAFIEMREAYLKKIDFESIVRVLDLGCGTGVVARSLAKKEGFKGDIVGIDFTEALIEAARRLTDEDGVGDRIQFRVGDSHDIEDLDNSYDIVIAHTLVSHVVDPAKVIADAARIVRTGGTVAIFDGDYASLAYGAGDVVTNTDMVNGILTAVVANPHVLRQMPALLRDSGLKISSFLHQVHAEAGESTFFLNLAESYVPIAIKENTISTDSGESWLATQRDASVNGSFFGACNYYTYTATKAD